MTNVPDMQRARFNHGPAILACQVKRLAEQQNLAVDVALSWRGNDELGSGVGSCGVMTMIDEHLWYLRKL